MKRVLFIILSHLLLFFIVFAYQAQANAEAGATITAEAESQANAKAEEDAKVQKITGAVVDKVQGVCKHFADKIDSGETFRDKTVDKLIELCEVLPALNINGDANIQAVHQKAMNTFYGKDITADKVRDDEDLAKELSDTAKEIVSDLDTKGGYFD